MPATRPTLSELNERITKDLESRVGTNGSSLRRSFIKILARVLAGAFHLLYGFLVWVFKQLFPQLADEGGVLLFGNIFGISRKAATFARFTVTITGTNGSEIAEGAELKRSDDVEFEVEEAVEIADGEAEVTVICRTEGVIGNTEEGAKLNFVSPIEGVDGEVTVGESVETATDIESLDEYRQRVLDRIQEPPHGGNESDYEAWAKEIAGVTRAWVYPLYLGNDSVGVTFVMDGREDIIPESADVAIVQEHIDELAPVTADVTVFAPIASPIDIEISNLSPGTAAVQAAIIAELKDLIRRDGVPGGTILISRIREAISTAAGELDHILVSPTANVVASSGELPILGEVTFT